MGSVFLFDLKTDKKCHRFDLHGKQLRSVSFTRDSARLLLCSDDLLINILDLYDFFKISIFIGKKS